MPPGTASSLKSTLCKTAPVHHDKYNTSSRLVMGPGWLVDVWYVFLLYSTNKSQRLHRASHWYLIPGTTYQVLIIGI